MAGQVFKKNSAGIKALLQSDGCLEVMESFASKVSNGGETRPFVGFDRAKVFVEQKRSKK